MRERTENLVDKQRDEWFGKIIHELRLHKLQLDSQTASKEVEEFYDDAMSDDPLRMSYQVRALAKKEFITAIIRDYIEELFKRDSIPAKLAFDYSDSSLLVWAEINSDEKAEDNLIITEAIINAKYYQYGFQVSSTIVESSDNLTIPPHYLQFVVNG